MNDTERDVWELQKLAEWLASRSPDALATERDVWELQKLAEWLASRSPDALAIDLPAIEKARNTLDQVIGNVRKVVRDAA